MAARDSTRAPAAQSHSLSLLRTALDEYSDALALIECAVHALDARESHGAELVTLHQGVRGLRLAHQSLDLAIIGLGGGAP